MKYLGFAFLLAIFTFTPYVAELPAQDATPESIARRQFNQVFVKVIIPVTARTPKQNGPVIEAWVAEQLKILGECEYFAVTSWVPVCDGLLVDDIVDNDVWSGSLGNASFCPVGGDIPERKDGSVLVSIGGWAPVGRYEARIRLADEPGTRAVEPVLHHAPSGEKKQFPGERPMAYVAFLVGPPPQEVHAAVPNRQNKAVNPSRR
jgi:hypothetical protein